jgi:hypothetical protein
MSKKRDRVEAEDLVTLYDLAWGQFQEDREIIVEQYKHLKKHIHDTPERYAINGDTLAKYAELLVKQTSQVVELIKIAQKQRGDKDVLTEEDFDNIAKEIEK